MSGNTEDIEPILRVVDSPLDEKERLPSAKEFFDESVVPYFRKAADIITGKVKVSHYPSLEVSDRMAVELREILALRALQLPKYTFFRDMREASWRDDKVVVKLVPYYGCHILLARHAEVAEGDLFAAGQEYYFEVAEFKSDENYYNGQPYWAIKESIENGKGIDSVEAQNIKKVIQLINDLLFKTVLEESEREVLADELSKLRMEVGEAARAVIKDFLNNYVDGDGWVHTAEGDITGGKKAGLVKDSVAYMKAIERLKVGKYDLRKLV